MVGSFLTSEEVFFFDNTMLSKPGLKEVIKDCWGSRNELRNNTMDMINQCRRWVLRWKKHANLNSRNKITRLKTALEREIAKTSPCFSFMGKLKQELTVAYKEEEIFWRQKFKEDWLKSTDWNTKFFS